jgi:hypothetical protein
MGCINSKKMDDFHSRNIEMTHIDNKEFIIIKDMIDLQQKIDFNIKNSYWNNTHNNTNCDLNNKNILCVIKKLGI